MTNPKAVITKACLFCGEVFRLPQCRDKRDRFCSSQCGSSHRAAEKAKRSKACEACGTLFIPRAAQVKAGHGKYCSIACRGAGRIGSKQSPEHIQKRVQATRGKTGRAGEANAKWQGGPKACVERRIKDGRAAAATRKYRAKNKEKMKEWDHRRLNRKVGRLPKNTVSGLYQLQAGKCAICKTSLGKTYHLDHILPLKLGGTHEKHNVQLLCPSCNVRKAAKHPIDFMQERGFLL